MTHGATGPALPGQVRSLGDRLPTGWYRLGRADDLTPGTVRAHRALGLDLVVWSDGEGVHAADAHCPHMGAHLGEGGHLNDRGELTCPFHGWCFDGVGAVADGPDRRANEADGLHLHPVRRSGDVWYVFVSHDPDRPAEPWEPLAVDDHGWGTPRRVTETVQELSIHQQVVIEGDLDVAHFPVLHERRFELSEASYDGAAARIAYDVTEPSPQRVLLELDGVSRVRQRVDYDEIRVMLSADYTTLAPDRTRVEGSIALWGPSEKAVDVIGGRIRRLLRRDIARDAAVWEHRAFDQPPVYGPDDGPLIRFRRWSEQFY